LKPQRERVDLPRTYVSRARLLRKLSQAVKCKLTVICANAGYGKTTLLKEFSGYSGLRTEWYCLTSADRDVVRLADGLGKSLSCLAGDPEPARDGRPSSHQPETPDVAFCSEALLRQAAQLGPKPSLLVLDDYHKAQGSHDVDLLITSLIDGAPPALRLVILSRKVPRLPLANLMARQELFTIAEEELAFTLEETSRFLRSEPALALDDEALTVVHERTEGWAAGLAMVLQSLRYGRQERVMSIITDPSASLWLVYDYLAEEVFDEQEPTIQDFLVKTSVLNSMVAPVCDHLLGASTSQLTLLALEERGLFTTSVGLSKRVFRYHHLFREFLREKLYQRESRKAVEALHMKAAEYYEGEASWEDCVQHYVKSGDVLKAAQVVEAVGERYIFSGLSQTVDHWFSILPRDLVATRPWLLAIKGRLAHMAGRTEDALRLLERALRLFRVAGDSIGQAWTAGEIGFVRYRCGQLGQSLHQFDLALSQAPSGNKLRSQLLTMRAISYRGMGRLDESVKDFEEALDELAYVDDEAVRLWDQSHALRDLAIARMEKGEPQDALSDVREAVELCNASRIGEREECWALAMWGTVLWANGDFEKSIASLNRALSLCSQFAHHQVDYISLWLGNSLRDSGHYAESDKSYAQSKFAMAEHERAFLAVLSGRAQSAKSIGALLRRRSVHSERIDDRISAGVTLAAVLRECHEPEKALELIREAVRLTDAHGYLLRKVSALLHQAHIEYELSRPNEGRETLRQALELAAARDYQHFFWWNPRVVSFLCQKALEEGIYADYASGLARQRLNQDPSPAPASIPVVQQVNASKHGSSQSASTSQTSTLPLDQAMAGCPDQELRVSLSRAVEEGLVAPSGVQILRSRYGLSWREIVVLTEYYFRPRKEPGVVVTISRRECAQRLFISENTVRCHINSIRSKLGLPPRSTGEQLFEWAVEAGLLPTRGV